MKILATADVHLGQLRFGHATPTGNSRLDDYARTLERFASLAIARSVDVAVFAGDTFDTRTPGPRSLAVLSNVVSELTEAGIHVLIVPGNHDGMTTIGDPSTHALNWLAYLRAPRVHVATEPSTINILGATFVTLPYPHKRALDLELPDVDPAARTEEASRRVEALIASLAEGQKHPIVFVGHLSVAGGKLGSERAMRFGWDVTIRADILAAFDLAILGHLHPPQDVGPFAVYCGSPEYIDFTEAGQAKSFVLATIDEAVAIERIPSGARLAGVFDIEQRPDGTFDLGPDGWYADGPIIRARVTAHATPTPAEVARLQRAIIAKGASYCEIELITPDAVPEPVEAATDALTPARALEQYLTSRGKPLEPTLKIGLEMIEAAQRGAEGGPA